MNKTDRIAIIVGLTEAIKQYGVPSKFCPTIAILIGALLGYLENPTLNGVIYGVTLGATVTGGYAVVKRAGTAVASSTPKPSDVDPETAMEHDDYRGV